MLWVTGQLLWPMVLIESWDDFYAEAEKLYTEHPDHVRAAACSTPYLSLAHMHCAASCQQTRYVMKYRHCDGKLELKVTNDRVVRCAAPCHAGPDARS